MQKFKASHSNRLIQIGFIVLGIMMGIVLGYSFVALDEAGAFTQASWELIESPIKFKHIADATTQTVWAKTEQNRFYCFGRPDCNQWTETKAVSVNSHGYYDRTIINKNTCIPSGIKYPRDPQGNVVECALSTLYFGVETKSIVYYAFLDDGTIWVWKSSGPWYVGFGFFIQVISPFIGLVLGLLMLKVFGNIKRAEIKQMKQMILSDRGIIHDK